MRRRLGKGSEPLGTALFDKTAAPGYNRADLRHPRRSQLQSPSRLATDHHQNGVRVSDAKLGSESIIKIPDRDIGVTHERSGRRILERPESHPATAADH